MARKLQAIEGEGRGWIGDTLANLVSGLGIIGRDKNVQTTWQWLPIDRASLEAAYRSDWVARKIIDIPPFDATREWRDWHAEGDQIEAIEAEETRHRLQRKVKQALRKARLYGGAVLVIGTGDEDATKPLNPETVQQGGLRYVHVASRYEITAEEIDYDVLSPWYGEPTFYLAQNKERNLQQRIHPSRVVRFIGSDIPDQSSAGENGWGDSVLQSTQDAVLAAGLTMQGVAALVHEAKLDVIKIPSMTEKVSTAQYRTRLLDRFALTAHAKSLMNITLMDKEEDWDRKDINFANLPDIVKVYLLIASGAADIPATRMLGQSPVGLNATGESDLQNYYDRIRAEQTTELGPLLERLDEVLIRSALGDRPPDVYYEWAPLWQMNELQLAEIAERKAKVFQVDVAAGLIDSEALRKARENQLIEDGTYPGLETALEEAEAEAEEDLDEEAEGVAPEPGASEAEEMLARIVAASAAGGAQAGADALAESLGRLGLGKLGKLIGGLGAKDAKPRPLYVRRDVLNQAEIAGWARKQGFKSIADDMHVTLLYSKEPVDWLKMGEAREEEIEVRAGGPRVVEPLGDKGALVLGFASSELSWRHEDMIYRGASHDYDEYVPHVTLSYDPGPEVLAKLGAGKIEPYRGRIRLGPEIFEEIRRPTEDEHKPDLFTHVGEDGTFGGYASRWATKYEDGTQIARGAFLESIARLGPSGIKMLWQHNADEPIGRWLEVEEDRIGLRVYGQLNMDLELAKEVASNIRKGIVSGLSIGTEGEEEKDSRGVITRANLVEISLVVWPMMETAKID